MSGIQHKDCERLKCDEVFPHTDCRYTHCKYCILKEKSCFGCNLPINEKDTDRIYDGDAPFHTECYYKAFPWTRMKFKLMDKEIKAIETAILKAKASAKTDEKFNKVLQLQNHFKEIFINSP